MKNLHEDQLTALALRAETWRKCVVSKALPKPELFEDVGLYGLVRVYMRIIDPGRLVVRFAGTEAMAKTYTMLQRTSALQIRKLLTALRLPSSITSIEFGHLISTQFQHQRDATHEVPALSAEDQLDIQFSEAATRAWLAAK
jgi:hypothetical protein